MGAQFRLVRGDILRCDAEALVNTVNCVGVMGRGVALQFKNAHPANFRAYAAACKRGEVQPGRMFVFETGRLTSPRYIINFPTKRHWRGRSRMADIESGLVALVGEIRGRRIRSIAVPPLGIGMGGLDWADVERRIEDALRPLDGVDVMLFEPASAPQTAHKTRTSKVPEMTNGRAVLLELMARYLGGLLDPFISLLEVHKLMYFMQEAGEPLKLRFAEAAHGPYAENLRHVLKKIEGYFISGYADGGDNPAKPLDLVPGAIDDARAFLVAHRETRARFERVGALVEGFESPLGLELLATVHWVIARRAPHDLEDVVRQTHGWNPRKGRFTPRQIALAADTLARQGWAAPSYASAHQGSEQHMNT